jgi:hypothetical protein
MSQLIARVRMEKLAGKVGEPATHFVGTAHSNLIFTFLPRMPRALEFLAAFLLSGLLWLGILWLVALGVRATDYSSDPRYQPPACSASVCPMYGLGGLAIKWKTAAILADIHGQRIVVPAGKICASSCALAVGFALGRGFDVQISPNAKFIPHNLKAIRLTEMPRAFKAKMLAYEPFYWR